MGQLHCPGAAYTLAYIPDTMRPVSRPARGAPQSGLVWLGGVWCAYLWVGFGEVLDEHLVLQPCIKSPYSDNGRRISSVCRVFVLAAMSRHTYSSHSLLGCTIQENSLL
jgi:hypothetical protein